MNHSEMEDLYELYVLNLLDSESASQIDEHLRTNCDVCTRKVQEASVLTASLTSLAPIVNPPASLRWRVLRAALPAEPVRPLWRFSLAAAAVVICLLALWSYEQYQSRRALTSEVAGLTEQRDALQSAVAILSQSDMKTVQFGGNQTVAHGRVFVSPSGGVVFVGSQLPQLAADHAFELWLIPAKGNPEPAGLFTKDRSGVSINVLPQPVDTNRIAAVAVSIEPAGGSLQPTTKPILIVPVA